MLKACQRAGGQRFAIFPGDTIRGPPKKHAASDFAACDHRGRPTLLCQSKKPRQKTAAARWFQRLLLNHPKVADARSGVWFESRIQVAVTSHETLTSQALSFAVSESSNQAVFFCCGNRRKALQDCLSSYRRRSSAVICRFYS